jgi:hypothetical protein
MILGLHAGSTDLNAQMTVDDQMAITDRRLRHRLISKPISSAQRPSDFDVFNQSDSCRDTASIIVNTARRIDGADADQEPRR